MKNNRSNQFLDIDESDAPRNHWDSNGDPYCSTPLSPSRARSSNPLFPDMPGFRYIEPGTVLAQEARGARAVLTTEQLPGQVHDGCKAALEAAGVVFGEPVQGDPLFVHATLPAGWKKTYGSNDSRDLVLLDEKGRLRAGIFYKNASYDRYANMHACRRYEIMTRLLDDYTVAQGFVVDRMLRERDTVDYHVVFATAPLHFKKDTSMASDDAEKNVHTECLAWADEHVPGWRNGNELWDSPTLPKVTTFPSYRR